MNIINKVIPKSKSVSLIIHLNNICNFKCNYCIAGKDFSKEYLSLEKIKTIINLLNLLKSDDINIDLTGGEPTLHKNFTDIIDLFLNSGINLNLQISTNSILLYKYEKWFKLNKDNINKNIVYFNISYHFFEYITKIPQFINSLKIVKENGFNFRVKFLLPDNNTSVDDFLKVRDQIINECNLSNNEFYYDLIIATNGNTTKTYNKNMLDIFNIRNNSKIKEKSTCNEKKSDIIVDFYNGKNLGYTIQEFRNSGLNKFRGYNCKYISKNNLIMQVSHRGDVSFGPCYTLDKLRYKIEDISTKISKGEQTIVCSDNFCVSGLVLEKQISKNYYKYIKLEKILKAHFQKTKFLFDFNELLLGYKSEMKIIFNDNSGNKVFFIVENIIKGTKYLYHYNDIGIYYYVKNEKNIPLDKDIFFNYYKNDILLILKNILLFKDILIKVIK